MKKVTILIFSVIAVGTLFSQTHPISKLSGDYIGSTDLIYKTNSQVMEELVPNIDQESKNRINKAYAGGRLRVDVERITKEEANASNFTVVINNEDGAQLFESKPANLGVEPTKIIFGSYFAPLVVPINKPIQPPFYVIVKEKGVANPCKFLVH